MSIVPEAFASNELVGQRELIAKPAPPPGLILCGRPLKKQAPISQEPNAVFDSQPVFKRAAPVRMLGDMVEYKTTLEYFINLFKIWILWLISSWLIYRYGLQSQQVKVEVKDHGPMTDLVVDKQKIIEDSSRNTNCLLIFLLIALHQAPNTLA